MSDFILNGEDYVDCIQNEEDLNKFNRIKEIWESGELAKPAIQCLDLIIEFDNLQHDLYRENRRKFIVQNSPKLN
jgi:hypothetical protein